MQAGSGGHFDNGGFTVAGNAEFGANGVAQRCGYVHTQPTAMGGINQGLHCAFAAVGHGNTDTFGIRNHFLPTFGNGISHFQRAQAFFEGIGGDYDFHDEFLYNFKSVWWFGLQTALFKTGIHQKSG